MGKPRKYNTEEERLAADRADKRRWYQKVKDEKKQVFRLRSKEEKKQVFRLRALRNYYKNKLKTLTEEPTDEQTEEITKVQNKINELTDAINNL